MRADTISFKIKNVLLSGAAAVGVYLFLHLYVIICFALFLFLLNRYEVKSRLSEVDRQQQLLIEMVGLIYEEFDDGGLTLDMLKDEFDVGEEQKD